MTPTGVLQSAEGAGRLVGRPRTEYWPALVLATVSLVVLVAHAMGVLQPRPASVAILLVVLVVLGVIDLRIRRVPNAIVYPAVLFGLGGAMLAGPTAALSAFAGGSLGFTLMLALAVAGRGAMGMGDVKLAALCGVVLGPRDIVPALTLGLCLAAGLAIALMVSHRASRKDSMPLVPFVAVATLLLVS